MVSNFDAKIRKKLKYTPDSEDKNHAGSTENGVAHFLLTSRATHVFHHSFSPKLARNNSTLGDAPTSLPGPLSFDLSNEARTIL